MAEVWPLSHLADRFKWRISASSSSSRDKVSRTCRCVRSLCRGSGSCPDAEVRCEGGECITEVTAADCSAMSIRSLRSHSRRVFDTCAGAGTTFVRRCMQADGVLRLAAALHVRHRGALRPAHPAPQRRQARTGDAVQAHEGPLQMHRDVVQHGLKHAQLESRVLLRSRVCAADSGAVTVTGLREGSTCTQGCWGVRPVLRRQPEGWPGAAGRSSELDNSCSQGRSLVASCGRTCGKDPEALLSPSTAVQGLRAAGRCPWMLHSSGRLLNHALLVLGAPASAPPCCADLTVLIHDRV